MSTVGVCSFGVAPKGLALKTLVTEAFLMRDQAHRNIPRSPTGSQKPKCKRFDWSLGPPGYVGAQTMPLCWLRPR